MSPGTTMIRVRRDLVERIDALGKRLDEAYSLRPWLKPPAWDSFLDTWTRSDVVERLLDHYDQHAERVRRAGRSRSRRRQAAPQATV